MSRFDDAIKDMQQRRKMIAEKIGTFVEAEAKHRVSVDTGHLRRSITHKTDHSKNKSSVFIGTNVEYAKVLEEGSEPHETIYDKPTHLKINGRWVTVKKIKHPGTKPQPYLKPSVEENIGKIQEMIKKGLSV
jgi:HK97 gp10 family phage protein